MRCSRAIGGFASVGSVRVVSDRRTDVILGRWANCKLDGSCIARAERCSSVVINASCVWFIGILLKSIMKG